MNERELELARLEQELAEQPQQENVHAPLDINEVVERFKSTIGQAQGQLIIQTMQNEKDVEMYQEREKAYRAQLDELAERVAALESSKSEPGSEESGQESEPEAEPAEAPQPTAPPSVAGRITHAPQARSTRKSRH